MLKLRRMKKEYTHNEILDFVRKHEMSLHREYTLEAYYKNDNAINRATKADGKANHKVAHPFCHQLVSTMVGYFASEPVQFDIDNEQVKAELDDFMKYNDFDRVFTKVITDSCIYGVGTMMTFVDVKGLVRFAPVDPKELIVLVNNDVLEDIHTVIRHWECENRDDKKVRYVEVYTEDKIRKFYMEDEELVGQEIIEEHFFGDVPFTLFYANAEQMSIFERVIPLVDAYDLLESETLNLVSDLSEAILLIAGVELDNDMIKQVNQMRLLNVSDANENNVDVRYITKDAPTNEETKQRIHDDIFSLSMIPDVNSKDFGEALSGTALKLRLASMEFLAGLMEGYAKLGLRRLVELWCNVNSLMGGVSTDEVVKNLNIRMTRNTVSNEAEEISNAIQLSSLVSKETVLGLLQSFIPDVVEEKRRLDEEREANMERFSDNYDMHSQDNGEEDMQDNTDDEQDDKQE